MNKRMKSKVQFENTNVKERNERGEEVIMVVTKQSEVEWEVRKFYWSLYRKDATMCQKAYTRYPELRNNGACNTLLHAHGSTL